MDLDLRNKCRACFTENDSMLSLFEVYEHDLTLANILQSCIATEVYPNDGLPSHLCDNCISIVTQFYNFRILYEHTDSQLREILPSTNECEREDNEETENKTVYSNFQEEYATIADVYSTEYEDENLSSEILDDETSNSVVVQEVQSLNLCDEISNLSSVKIKLENVNEIIIEENCGVNTCSTKSEHSDVDTCDEDLIVPNKVAFTTNNADFSSREMELQEITKYECQDCGEAYLYPSGIQKHMNTKHKLDDINVEDYSTVMMINVPKGKKPELQEITKYECRDCGEAYLYSSGIQKHMSTKHKLDDINIEDYSTVMVINVPKRKSEPEMQQNEILPVHECEVCHKRFCNRNVLLQHKEIHVQHKKFTCEICGNGFVKKSYLRDHRHSHNTERKYACKICHKTYKRRSVLMKHMRIHTHPRSCICEVCGKAFNDNGTLQTHRKLLHTKIRDHKCFICGLAFPLKATLDKHIRRHQNRNKTEKDFPCTLCAMQYKDKSSLKRHMECKHEGKVKEFACLQCPKKYTSKANLLKHLKKKHLCKQESEAESG